MDGAPVRIALEALRDGVPHKVELGDTPIVLIRQAGTVSALAGACPHAGAPLEKGAVCEGRLICPWHKAAFSVADGALLEPPALAPLTRYAVRIEAGTVIVDGTTIAPDAPTPAATDPGTIAIVGSGAAASGALALLGLRGHPGRVVVVSRETPPPYDRTVLSKMVISGDMPPEAKPVLEDGGFPTGMERVTGEVIRLDATRREIHLADGRSIGFDQALLASDGTPRIPPLPGVELAGIHALRSVADAVALMSSIEPARRAVILGAGFIGLEVASGLRERDIDVTIVCSDAVPLARTVGKRLGHRIRALHESKGVTFVEGRIARFEGSSHVEQVVLEDSAILPCDLVVLGTGVAPAVGFVEGVESRESGMIVDAMLEAAPGLFAAGDAARFAYRGEMVRIEHWRLAQQHGWLAARNMLGDRAVFEGVPFFWTAQHGVRLDYLGHADEWDDEIIEGDLDQMDFVLFLVRNGEVSAAIGCARDAQMARLSDAMRRPLPVDEARTIARQSY